MRSYCVLLRCLGLRCSGLRCAPNRPLLLVSLLSGLLLLLIPGLRNSKLRWQRTAAIAGILIPCLIAVALALSQESLSFETEW